MTTDKVRRALISVSDKTGVVEFARALLDRGWMIISTGGTYDALKKAGLNVLKVKDFTGFEEILDGRVKTLHPKVHGGILARRKNAEHVATLQRSGIPEIDLVAVNLYPFRQTAVKTGVSFEDLVEQIDIGGPAMVRSAAKNAEDVLAVVDPEDYPGIILQLDLPDGPSQACRFELMRKAFLHTAAYDTMIAGTLSRVRFEGGLPVHEPLNLDGPVPDLLTTMMSRQMTLRYGENPHQQAGWYLPVGSSPTFAQLQGKELSYTNMLDLEAARRIVGIFPDSPAACVVKHTNPCGVSRASNITDAYVLARDADPLSAFGGIVGLNQPLDAATAREIVRTFIEGVIAPAVDPDALAVLAKKADLRVIADISPVGETEMRPALGGVLVQEVDYVYEAWTHWGPHRDNLKVVTKRQPTEAEWDALRFAWRICAMVKSNAVILTLEDRTMGIGGGQPNRVGSAKIACGALTGDIVDWRGCVAASDAFFPFRDGLDVVARAGATAVVQPGGSKNDPEVIAAADEHGLAMVFTGRRHFRH